jgi:hypothetical protein
VTLLDAPREARPATVRHLFALVSQHARWERTDQAPRLDEQPAAVELMEELVPIPDSSSSVQSPVARGVLEAVDGG